MQVLLVDGHPAPSRLSAHLLDSYAAGLPPEAQVTRLAVRDLSFDPNLAEGYSADQPPEPDVLAFQQALRACDHLVLAFPLWWGAEPARLKGLWDRALLPGFGFKYHPNDPWWDRLLAGRSADVIITADTPRLYHRLVYGDGAVKRMKRQILGFVGFSPVRVFYFGPVRRGGAEKSLESWRARLKKAASALTPPKRGPAWQR